MAYFSVRLPKAHHKMLECPVKLRRGGYAQLGFFALQVLSYRFQNTKPSGLEVNGVKDTPSVATEAAEALIGPTPSVLED
jgi:hypothetical protein